MTRQLAFQHSILVSLLLVSWGIFISNTWQGVNSGRIALSPTKESRPVLASAANPQYCEYHVYSECDGELSADGDGRIDAGEDLTVDVYVQNVGGTSIYSVAGNLTTADPYVVIPGNIAQFGSITSSGGTSNGRFRFMVSGNCPDKRPIPFSLALKDNSSTEWDLSFTIWVNGTPEYSLVSYQFYSNLGDGDSNLDAGEQWYVEVTLNNTGTACAENAYAYLDSADKNITFVISSYSFRYMSISHLYQNQTVTLTSSYTWRFIINKTIKQGQTIHLTLNITDYSTPFDTTFTLTGTVLESFPGDAGLGQDAGDSFTTARLITVGATLSPNYLSPFADTTDYFRIYLIKDRRYTFRMVHGLSYDFELAIHSPSQSQLVANTTGYYTTTITLTISYNGYYFIRVYGYSYGGDNSYSLQASDVTTTGGSTATSPVEYLVPIIIGIVCLCIVVIATTWASNKIKGKGTTTQLRNPQQYPTLNTPTQAGVDHSLGRYTSTGVQKIVLPPKIAPRWTASMAKIEEQVVIERALESTGEDLRLQITLDNRSFGTFTNLSMELDVPSAVQWEVRPNMDLRRVGHTILFPRLGTGERKIVTFILKAQEPVEGYISGILTLTDAWNVPQIIPMKPKRILLPPAR